MASLTDRESQESSSSCRLNEILPERVLLHLHQARGLRVADVLGKSDPYVKVMADGQFFFQSRCKRQTLNPTWEEACGIPPADKQVFIRKLLVEVYDADIGQPDESGPDDYLGRALVTLEPGVLNNGPQVGGTWTGRGGWGMRYSGRPRPRPWPRPWPRPCRSTSP
jgi:hypothetical protein